MNHRQQWVQASILLPMTSIEDDIAIGQLITSKNCRSIFKYHTGVDKTKRIGLCCVIMFIMTDASCWAQASIQHCRNLLHEKVPRRTNMFARDPDSHCIHGGGLFLEERETPPLLNVPVYALATLGPDGRTNMNILTYATPVGIRPSRMWCISLYRKTMSHANFLARRSGVLQLLQKEHASLIYLLGGQSGQDATLDKAEGCKAQGFEWQRHDAVEELLLPGCTAYLDLVLEGDTIDAGDHGVAICRVRSMLYAHPNSAPPADGAMLTSFLREKGLISDVGRAIPPEAAAKG